MILALGFWKKSSSRMKRLLSIGAVFILALIATVAGTLTPLSQSEANDLNQELEKLGENVDVQYIFGNNMMICLIMFIPFIGPLIGFITLYNTGLVIGAAGVTAQVSPLLVLMTLFIFPFTWMEFVAYSTGLAESVWLIWRLVRRRDLAEFRKACIFVTICAVILLAAAVIEMAIIQAMPRA